MTPPLAAQQEPSDSARNEHDAWPTQAAAAAGGACQPVCTGQHEHASSTCGLRDPPPTAAPTAMPMTFGLLPVAAGAVAAASCWASISSATHDSGLRLVRQSSATVARHRRVTFTEPCSSAHVQELCERGQHAWQVAGAPQQRMQAARPGSHGHAPPHSHPTCPSPPAQSAARRPPCPPGAGSCETPSPACMPHRAARRGGNKSGQSRGATCTHTSARAAVGRTWKITSS